MIIPTGGDAQMKKSGIAKFVCWVLFGMLLIGIANASLTDNLLHYYKSDNTTVSGIVMSSSVNGYSCNLTGTTNSIAGKIIDARNYNSVGYCNAGNSTNSLITGDWTATAWVKTTTIAAGLANVITIDDGSGGNNIIWIDRSGSTLRCYAAKGGASGVAAASTALVANADYVFVACKHKNGANISMFYNGTWQSSAVYVAGPATVALPLSIGTWMTSPTEVSRNWTGSIDEVGIWTRALSDAEITSLYNSGAGLSYPFSTTPVISLINFTSDGGCTGSGTCPQTFATAPNFVVTASSANYCNSTGIYTGTSTAFGSVNCTTADNSTFNCLHNTNPPIGDSLYYFTCNGTNGWSAASTFGLWRAVYVNGTTTLNSTALSNVSVMLRRQIAQAFPGAINNSVSYNVTSNATGHWKFAINISGNYTASAIYNTSLNGVMNSYINVV